MDIETIIIERRTIHRFTSQPVPQEVIDRAITLATWAPNHRMTQPWRIYQVGPVSRTQLAEISVELKQKKNPDKALSVPVKQAIKNDFLKPSHLLIISQIKSIDPIQNKEDYATLSCAVENLFLYLWSKKIGTKWSTGAITRDPRTYEIAGINPNEQSIEGFLWIGHPEEIPSPPPRLALSTIHTHLP